MQLFMIIIALFYIKKKGWIIAPLVLSTISGFLLLSTTFYTTKDPFFQLGIWYLLYIIVYSFYAGFKGFISTFFAIILIFVSKYCLDQQNILPTKDLIFLYEEQSIDVIIQLLFFFTVIGAINLYIFKKSNQYDNNLLSLIDEKNNLLKEVHHRVKNNLQIISSLMSLQAMNTDNEEVKQILSSSESRVNSMGMIHEMLYSAKKVGDIDFKAYISELTASLFASYAVPDQKINSRLTADEVHLGISTAIPLGLMINEIINNSIKYAFPDKTIHKDPLIFIEIIKKKNNEYVFTIGDNGCGFNPAAEKTKKSLGTKLLQNLSKQLNAKMKMESNSSGTSYEITLISENLD